MWREEEDVGEAAIALEQARNLVARDASPSDLHEANSLVARALALCPESAAAWLLKCQVLSALGDDTAALAAVEMSLRNASQPSESHYWRSAVLSDLNRPSEALKAIEKCFRTMRADDFWLLEDSYCEKAMILNALGRNEEAVTTYEDGLRRCPSSSLLRAELAPLRRANAKAKLTVVRGGVA